MIMLLQRAPYAYRNDLAVPSFADDRPVVIFDRKCVLCSVFARFILRAARFRLLAAQSNPGMALYRHFSLRTDSYETCAMLEGGEASLKPDATIRILDGLSFPWRLGRQTCVVGDCSWRGRLLS